MGRKKLISTDDAISLIDEYYVENPYKKISAEDISRFAASKGIEVPGRVLRRDTKFAEYLESTNKSINELIDDNSSVVVFRSMNVDDFISKHSNITDLKNALTQRDCYYEKICKKYNLIVKENKELKRNDGIQYIDELIKYKNLSLKLKKFIDKNINPSIANSILEKEGLLKELNSIVVEPEVINLKSNFEVKELNEIAKMFDDK